MKIQVGSRVTVIMDQFRGKVGTVTEMNKCFSGDGTSYTVRIDGEESGINTVFYSNEIIPYRN